MAFMRGFDRSGCAPKLASTSSRSQRGGGKPIINPELTIARGRKSACIVCSLSMSKAQWYEAPADPGCSHPLAPRTLGAGARDLQEKPLWRSRMAVLGSKQ